MSKLINLSEATSLALHGMSLIAKAPAQRLSVKALAQALNASPAHLAKVFQKLNKADLTRSVRGPAGGFELQQPATEISVLQIYEAIEGKIKLAACPLGKEVCAFRSCIFSSELSRISAEIYAAYQSIKLSEM